MLSFPIIAFEQTNKITFKYKSFFMLIKRVENMFKHILIDHKSWQNMIISDPFIKRWEEKFFITSRYCIESLI